jgi:hypothetical protein
MSALRTYLSRSHSRCIETFDSLVGVNNFVV